MSGAAIAFEPIKRLSRDMAKAASTLSKREARYLVDAYYMMQNYRISANNQIRALDQSQEPHSVLQWLSEQNEVLESQIKRALDKWTDSDPLGVWCKSITGIGPVIAAGLLANIDITKAPTAGHIWAFAGLDPTQKWEKGQKRPYNAQLKTLCVFKLGESFVKVQANKNDVYGKLFAERKAIEKWKNENGDFADQAKAILERKRIGQDTQAYAHLAQGRLPPAQIHARARRWAVKIFLSHYHDKAFRLHYNTAPPAPFAIAILNHAHMIYPPGFKYLRD